MHRTGPTSASEDFGSFGQAWQVPAVFWFVGGTDPDTYAAARATGEVNKIPSNHSPYFAPVIHPTLETGGGNPGRGGAGLAGERRCRRAGVSSIAQPLGGEGAQYRHYRRLGAAGQGDVGEARIRLEPGTHRQFDQAA